MVYNEVMEQQQWDGRPLGHQQDEATQAAAEEGRGGEGLKVDKGCEGALKCLIVT